MMDERISKSFHRELQINNSQNSSMFNWVCKDDILIFSKDSLPDDMNMEPTKRDNGFTEVAAASSGMRTSFLSVDTSTTKRSPNVFYGRNGKDSVCHYKCIALFPGHQNSVSLLTRLINYV